MYSCWQYVAVGKEAKLKFEMGVVLVRGKGVGVGALHGMIKLKQGKPKPCASEGRAKH